ncbi:MAG: hypothetical protein KDD22_08870, partial [Bdellovibrionales bacterium]|nr:hypothetical protein [Bdellovibrionales bacterium]
MIRMILAFLGTSLLVMGFQNCGDVQFQEGENLGLVEKVDGDGVVDQQGDDGISDDDMDDDVVKNEVPEEPKK